MIEALINGGFFIAGCVLGSAATFAIMLEAKRSIRRKRRHSSKIDIHQKKRYIVK